MNKLFLSSLLSLGLASSVCGQTLTLSVETTMNSGVLSAAIFDSQASFESDKAVMAKRVPVQTGPTTLSFVDLPAGTYGVALFQDENGNQKLDVNLLGAPKEPFGFSGNPKIGFSAPTFDAFKFDFDGTDQTLSITLNGG